MFRRIWTWPKYSDPVGSGNSAQVVNPEFRLRAENSWFWKYYVLVFLNLRYKTMKNRETNILKQSTDTLSMGCYLGWHVVVPSVLRTETKQGQTVHMLLLDIYPISPPIYIYIYINTYIQYTHIQIYIHIY